MMPSSRTIVDLEPWTKFSPKERQNDYEYNLLLSKFKSLLNEVKSFREIHKNCPTSQADNLNEAKSSLEERNITSPDGFGTGDEFRASPSASNNRNVIQSNGRLNFQSQNPIIIGSPRSNDITHSDGRNRNHVSNLSRLYNQQSQQHHMPKHYNSSHNLLLSSSTNISNNDAITQPETKQRSQTTHLRLLASRSSERLNMILDNNNHSPFIKANDLGTNHSTQISPPIARGAKFLEDDDNIYDAVSPDDITCADLTSQAMASSINNISRLSLQHQHKTKLEPLKSSPVAGSYSGKSNSHFKDHSSNKVDTSEFNSQDRLEHSFGSSVLLDPSINTSSSLSTQNDQSSRNQSGNIEYANYVNIDFFLKRGDSPSIDDLDENMTHDESSDVSDEEATQMSHSFSSDQLCEDALRNLSPRELAKRLSSKVNTNSSSSLTPASSGDFLDDHRGPSSMNANSTSGARFKDANNKLASFFSMNGREVEHSSLRKNSTNPRDSIGLMKNLGPIHESSSSFMLSRKNTSLDTYLLEGKDNNAIAEAHTTMRSFLSDLNLSPVDDLFEDKAQRRIVKESFAVEFCKRRKLRHLFLFNDVIVCAKYQASSKQKFTFDVKWYLNLSGISVLDPADASNHVKYDKEAIENQILAIRTNLMMLRSRMQHIKRSKDKQPAKLIKKLKKSRTELEAELVLLLPHLPLVIKHINGRKYTFFLSSNFDRNQWIESIKFLQSQLASTKSISTTPSSSELQAWIQTCRKNLNPSLGTFLLRSNCDDDLLYGDLYVNLSNIRGITKPGNYYFCFEVDSYGHFSQKASSTAMRIENLSHDLNDEYVFPLDGAHTLRILIYENLGSASKPSVVGKAHVELSRSWFLEKHVDKVIVFNTNCSLSIRLSYSSSELLSMRIPHTKLCPTFAMDITQVCKKERTNIPLLIQLCVNEVERRGMREVGIYRMSGTSTDIQRLKKTFETNSYVAELLLRDIDIHSVTGFLKTYLREMPEGLFINKLYLKFVAAFNIPQSDSLERTKKMLELFNKIPPTNQQTIIYLVEHLVKINKFESYNKMSLTNLATVIGPNILRPPTDSQSQSTSDPFTAVVIGSMSQAGILYFFLNRAFLNLPLMALDPSEINRSING